MRRLRRNHSAAFKAKVAVAAIRATSPWPSLLSDLTFTPVRSRSGNRSFSNALVYCLANSVTIPAKFAMLYVWQVQHYDFLLRDVRH